jgi:hypothetical protein
MPQQPTLDELTSFMVEALALGVSKNVPNDIETKTLIEKYLLHMVSAGD